MKDIVQSWRSPAWRSAAVLAIVIVASCPALAADELSGLLPADPLAVVRVTGLAEVWDIVKASHAMHRVEEDSPPQIIVGYENARNGLASFQEMFTFNLEKTVKDLIGSDCALAVYEDNKAVFISVGEDKTELAAAANFVVTLERNFGRVQNEETLTYEGVDVIRMSLVRPNKPGMPAKERYHCFINNALVLSEDLDMLKKVVDLSLIHI